MQPIPLKPVPSQTLTVLLNNQPCRINVYQKSTGLYLDLYVNDALIIGGVLCLNANRIVRDAYLGFLGDLAFFDTQAGAQAAPGATTIRTAPIGTPNADPLTIDGATMPLTVFRSSPGTYFDAAGVMQTAPAGVPRFTHDPATLAPMGLVVEGSAGSNLCAYREAIGNSAGWNPFGTATAALGAATAPDGTSAASLLAIPTNSGWYSKSFQPMAAGQTGTISVWLRSVTGTSTVRLALTESISDRFLTCNLTTSWQLFSLSYTAPSAATGFNLQLDTASATLYAWGATITFDGLSSYITQAMGTTRAAETALYLPAPAPAQDGAIDYTGLGGRYVLGYLAPGQ